MCDRFLPWDDFGQDVLLHAHQYGRVRIQPLREALELLELEEHVLASQHFKQLWEHLRLYHGRQVVRHGEPFLQFI